MQKQKVQPIPVKRPTLIPYLIVEDVARLIGFLKTVFKAEEKVRTPRADGSVMHAELSIGNSILMMGEPNEEFGLMPASIFVTVDDCDAVFEKAVVAGGTSVMEPTDMPHAGERYGGVKDFSGNIWWIATHIEDVSKEEAKRRLKELGL